jgi:hypothetical protein
MFACALACSAQLRNRFVLCGAAAVHMLSVADEGATRSSYRKNCP